MEGSGCFVRFTAFVGCTMFGDPGTSLSPVFFLSVLRIPFFQNADLEFMDAAIVPLHEGLLTYAASEPRPDCFDRIIEFKDFLYLV